MKAETRQRIGEWYDTITYGEKRRYGGFIAWLYFDSLFASIPYSVLMIAVYFILQPLVGGDTNVDVATPLWVMTGVLLVQTILYALIRRKSYLDICVGHSQAQLKEKLRIGDRLKKLSMGFYATHDAGSLSTLLVRDYEEIENMSSSMVGNITVIGLRLLLSLIVLTAFNWQMTIAMFIVIPLAIPFVVISYKRLAHESSEHLSSQEETASSILEYVGGITTLQAYGRAGEAFEKLQVRFARLRDASKRQEKAGAPVSMFGRAVLFLGIAVVIFFGAYLFLNGQIDAFFYIMCILAALQVYDPIVQLFVLIISMARTNQCVRRITELKKEEGLAVREPVQTTDSADIAFENVRFSYDGKSEVLKGVTFSAAPRTLTALVGGSGSGKTTIMRLIARFFDASEGAVKIGGVPVTNMTQEQLLSKISMVFQNVYLFHDTIEANIRMAKPDATHEEIEKAAKAAACHDFISKLPDGYDTVVGEGGSTLSGGEKQRISIARAILSDAPIVLLDEATASLDPGNEILVQNAIDELVKDRTVLVIAHRLQSTMNADNILVLDNGKIAEQGTHLALLKTNGIYAALWNEQQKAGKWKL